MTYTDYLWFNTKQRQEFIRITDQVASFVAQSGIQEGLVLVSPAGYEGAETWDTPRNGLLHKTWDVQATDGQIQVALPGKLALSLHEIYLAAVREGELPVQEFGETSHV